MSVKPMHWVERVELTYGQKVEAMLLEHSDPNHRNFMPLRQLGRVWGANPTAIQEIADAMNISWPKGHTRTRWIRRLEREYDQPIEEVFRLAREQHSSSREAAKALDVPHSSLREEAAKRGYVWPKPISTKKAQQLSKRGVVYKGVLDTICGHWKRHRQENGPSSGAMYKRLSLGYSLQAAIENPSPLQRRLAKRRSYRWKENYPK